MPGIEAVILLAGYGRRMQPLSDDQHKTLLTVGGKPVINRIIDALISNNIHTISIVLGYQAEQLREHLQQNYPSIHFSWIINKDYRNNNNIVSLSLALKQLSGEQLLLIEGDLVIEPEIIKKAISQPLLEIMLVDDYKISHDGTVISATPVNDSNELFIVDNIYPPRLQCSDFNYKNKYKTLNIYSFSAQFALKKLLPAIDKHIAISGTHAYYEEVVGILLHEQKIPLHALHIKSSLWEEIDDPLDVDTANFTFTPATRYDTLRQTHGAYWSHETQDYAYLSNPYFPTPAMLAQMQHHLPQLLSSYGSNQATLDKKTALLAGVNPKNIITLNGLSQIYPLLQPLLPQPVSIPLPSFGEYQRCLPQANAYADTGDNQTDWKTTIEFCKTVVIVNPNNPTGSIIQSCDIMQAIEKNTDTLFVVDESFIDFSNQQSLMTFNNIQQYSNVLILKSFGKSMGIAGLRLAYAYSPDKQLINKLRQQLPIWNINSLAEFFLEITLKNKDTLAASHEKIKQDRTSFVSALESQHWVSHIYLSQANFVLVKLKLSEQQVEQWCLHLAEKHNVLLKTIKLDSHCQLAHLRLPLKTQQQNGEILKLLTQTFNDLFIQEKTG